MTRRSPMGTSLGSVAGSALLLFVAFCGSPLSSQTQSLTVPKSSPDEVAAIDDLRRLPKPLQGLGFESRLGDTLPLDLEFLDQNGERVALGSLLRDRPLLLAPVYFDCPMLCSMVLDGVVRGIKPLQFRPGQEFDVVAVSFDVRELPEHAAKARDTVLARYRHPETADGWTFLVAEPDHPGAVAELMDSIGFRYRFDEKSGLFAHAGGLVVVTPEGKVSRYFSGVDFAPKDLKLSLLEAADGGIGTWVDQVVLFCYQYDSELGQYSAATMRIVRIGGVLTVLFLGAFLIVNWRRDRLESVASQQEGIDKPEPSGVPL